MKIMANNPKLTILFEKMRGLVFELDKDQLSVGRKDGMDICIKESSLSSYHCDFIRLEDGSYMLRDNNSTNGTRVNNEPVTEKVLKNSDIIQLGSVEMLYDSNDHASSGTISRTHTIDLDSTEMNLAGVRELSNLSPFAQAQRAKQKKVNALILVSIGVFGTLLVAFVIFVLVKMFSK
jgi:pSer/pThr/pTyr-binding forkhead associated (FHA) protein